MNGLVDYQSSNTIMFEKQWFIDGAQKSVSFIISPFVLMFCYCMKYNYKKHQNITFKNQNKKQSI